MNVYANNLMESLNYSNDTFLKYLFNPLYKIDQAKTVELDIENFNVYVSF